MGPFFARKLGDRVRSRAVGAHRHWASITLLGAVCALVVFVAVWTLEAGVRSWGVAPVPPLVSGIVTALVDVIRGMRMVCPYVAVAGLLLLVCYRLAAVWSPRARVFNRLAGIDYAGIDHLRPPKRTAWSWLGRRLARWFAGTGLAILAIVLVGATSGVENEVTNGPLRPVDATVGLVSAKPVTFVLQGPDITFMDDSSISETNMRALVRAAPFPVVPFGKHLFNIDNKSAMEISVPDASYAQLTGQPAPAACGSASIVVDDTVGVPVGGSVSVNGTDLIVAKVESGIAQMNRSIGVMADSTARRCVEGGTNTGYWGALAATGDSEAVSRAISSAGLSGMNAVSESAFKENNRDFWRANATPLLLQIILYLTLFSGFAAAGERQSALQRNSRELGMLHAGGVDWKGLRAVEYRRALRTTFTAALVAAPLMVPVAAAFNASELGVHIAVGLTELSVGTSLTLLAMLLAARRSLSQFKRSLDLPLAVKG